MTKQELKSGCGRQSEPNKPNIDDLGLPPTIPCIEKTPLSPVKELLCVALIWLLIAGIPLSFRYYAPLFPIVWGGQALVEYWLRKKYNIAFLPRRFLNWLYATRAWDIFVLRSKKNPKAAALKNWAMVCLFLGCGILYIVYLDATSAAVELSEMREVSGTLEDWKWHTGRYSCGDTLVLRLRNGETESFRNYLSKETANYYNQIKGQEVTVLTQEEPHHINPSCRKSKIVRQLKHGNRTIVFYSKLRAKKINTFFTNIAKTLFAICFIIYMRIWTINRTQ